MLEMKQAVLIRAAIAGTLTRFYYPGARFDVVMVAGRTRKADGVLLAKLTEAGLLIPPPENSNYPMTWQVTGDGAAAYEEFRRARKWK